MMTNYPPGRLFWQDALTWTGSASPRVFFRVLFFGGFATIIVVISQILEAYYSPYSRLSLAVAPFEFAGAVLGVLLVLRVNAGHERWWEARILWGGIVNQSRNLVIAASAYGPKNHAWQRDIARLSAAFPRVCRTSLQELPPDDRTRELIGDKLFDQLLASPHQPGFVSAEIARRIEDARQAGELDGFAYMRLETERSRLIDHVGGCERIYRTPMPRVLAIKVRQFCVMFLMTLPLALLHHLGSDWLVPLITMLIAYPILALEQIGVELQNPFSMSQLSHLPLDQVCATIERSVLPPDEASPKGDRPILHGEVPVGAAAIANPNHPLP